MMEATKAFMKAIETILQFLVRSVYDQIKTHGKISWDEFCLWLEQNGLSLTQLISYTFQMIGGTLLLGSLMSLMGLLIGSSIRAGGYAFGITLVVALTAVAFLISRLSDQCHELPFARAYCTVLFGVVTTVVVVFFLDGTPKLQVA